MDTMMSFYGMLVFVFVTVVGGWIAAIIFLKPKQRKSTEAQIARRALLTLGVKTKQDWKTLVISASKDVEIPLEKLWETWTRLEDWPEWSALHTSTRWEGEAAWQVGARFEQALTLGFPFGRVSSVETVAQFSPQREVGWCKEVSGVKSCHIWSFYLLPNRHVRVTSTEVFHGTLIGVLKPVILFQWQRLFEKTVNGLVRQSTRA